MEVFVITRRCHVLCAVSCLLHVDKFARREKKSSSVALFVQCRSVQTFDIIERKYNENILLDKLLFVVLPRAVKITFLESWWRFPTTIYTSPNIMFVCAPRGLCRYARCSFALLFHAKSQILYPDEKGQHNFDETQNLLAWAQFHETTGDSFKQDITLCVSNWSGTLMSGRKETISHFYGLSPLLP